MFLFDQGAQGCATITRWRQCECAQSNEMRILCQLLAYEILEKSWMTFPISTRQENQIESTHLLYNSRLSSLRTCSCAASRICSAARLCTIRTWRSGYQCGWASCRAVRDSNSGGEEFSKRKGDRLAFWSRRYYYAILMCWGSKSTRNKLSLG